MDAEFINLTPDNLPSEHLCCIVRTKTAHPGVEAKRRWLSERLPEGHVFRKLNVRGTMFIEYAPLEEAWVPILGDNYLYIYCLWVDSGFKHKGYGQALMEYCLADARAQGKSGVCMLGADKQKAWLANQAFAERFGFQTVDTTDYGYQLLALSFDGSLPLFAPGAKRGTIDDEGLVVYYDGQCPFVLQNVETIREYAKESGAAVSLRPVTTLQEAKALPGVFNNWAVFCKGRFVTVNLLLDIAKVKKLLEK